VQKAKATDMADRKAKISACKAAMQKILARIRYDKLRKQNGLLYFDINSVRYDTVGPVANHMVGIWCSFTLTEPALLNIDRDDWEDGAAFDDRI
jgi:hypothetical protein